MHESRDVVTVIEALRPLLTQEALTLPNEYRYAHVSLALIDAIYSINARYESVRRTVLRYANYAHLNPYRPCVGTWPSRAQQQPLSAFLDLLDARGADDAAERIFQNRQRTSTRNGILKAEAVREAARLLVTYGVSYFQDIPHVIDSREFIQAFRSLRGQGSGTSLTYFWMLTGSESLAKPDRQILRYLSRILTRPLATSEEAIILLQRAVEVLKPEFPQLTTRALDYAIWQGERRQLSPE